MSGSPANQFHFFSQLKWLGIAALVFLSISAYAQNTKGDKPANSQSIFKIPRLKSKAKGGDKAYSGDISGRRIRTKNKSSAQRAVQTSPPVANRKPTGDKPYKTPGGRYRIKSHSAQAARNNIYPTNYQFSNNPSRYPRENQHAYSNRRVLSRAAAMQTKRLPPGRKKIITSRTASRSYVTRGRKNVYWGKFHKGERPITTDIAGRPLRAKNYHSPGIGITPVEQVYKTKRRPGDRPYQGTFKSGFVTTPRSTRAWRGDVSGHAIRRKYPKAKDTPGHVYELGNISISGNRRGLSRPLRGSGLAFHSGSGRISNRRIQNKAPGLGAMAIDRALGKYRGKKRPQGGISASRGFNNKGEPIIVRTPGKNGKLVGKYQGFFKGGVKAFSTDGYGYAGNLKSQRAAKGGGSIRRQWNNNGQPVQVKGPGIGARFVDTYRGFMRGQKAFSTEGYGYTGNMKAQRALKGGGSISGRRWNNSGQPVQVKGPGIGGRYVDTYQGFMKGRKAFSTDGYGYAGSLKSRRLPKGGGSVSGKLWNNSNQAIAVKGPGIGGRYVDTYQGFMRGRKVFSTDGYDYAGDLKTRRAPKGGGSVSTLPWNNSNQPIVVKGPGIGAKYIDTYQGFLKARKPEKGGGSVSGKLWNNKEKPIEGKAFPPESRKLSVYPGDKKIKKSEFVRNPNAKEEALKKTRPDKTTFLVNNLFVKTKPKEYDRNKFASKSALKGVSAGKNSLKAIEYGSRMKMLWTKTFGNEADLAGRVLMKKYVHNPNSKKAALMVMAPARANARIGDLQVNVKMTKAHGHNLHPDAQFAHSLRHNVKQERTFLITLKLKWAKLFKKNDTQPSVVKEKVRRPRYDPKERDLWKDLYD